MRDLSGDVNGKPRLLITGVTGLLGSALVREGLAGHQVWGWARRPAAAPVPCRVEAVDLLDEAAVSRAVEALSPDIVIHSAALTSVDQCESDASTAAAVNVGGTKHLLKALRGHACRFVFVSTDAVFDGTGGDYTEEDSPSPLHIYGRTKLAGEQAVLTDRPDALVTRSAFYGWNVLPKESLGEWVLGRLRGGESVPGFTDLFFSPLLADHLARLMLAFAGRAAAGVLHMGSADGCSKFEFADRLAAVFGFPTGRVVPSTYQTERLAAPRPRNVTLNSGRAAALFGRPLPGIEEGLREFLKLEPAVKRPNLAGARAPVGGR
jgi:dTDP-4-dehydrorhamnose reductase